MTILGSQTEFFEEGFNGVTLHNEQISGKAFYDCTFSNCSLRETALIHCTFNGCTFKDCDLSLINVTGSSLRDTNFERSSVIGVNWTLAAWPEFTRYAPIHFTDCTIDYSTFIGLSLERISFRKCHAVDVDFSEAHLAHADFREAALTRSRFRHTDLTEANFEGATEYSIKATENTIRKARFSLLEAISLLYGLDITLVE